MVQNRIKPRWLRLNSWRRIIFLFSFGCNFVENILLSTSIFFMFLYSPRHNRVLNQSDHPDFFGQSLDKRDKARNDIIVVVSSENI